MDGVYFDAPHKRVYVSGGRGFDVGSVFIYQQRDADGAKRQYSFHLHFDCGVVRRLSDFILHQIPHDMEDVREHERNRCQKTRHLASSYRYIALDGNKCRREHLY
jgi:hypothetical protein